MTMHPPTWDVELLDAQVSDADLAALAQLLVDAVATGAAVSFTAPLTLEAARNWWAQSLAARGARSACLVVRDAGGIIGTAQLLPAWAPNQPHRADVVKVLVHRARRGAGVATALMRAIEREAAARDFSLLTLDCKTGSAAESLYRQLGWQAIGVVPGYALDPDGTPHDATFFYKSLAG